jgi:hypothetical protein
MNPPQIGQLQIPPAEPAVDAPRRKGTRIPLQDPFVHAVTIATVAGFVAQGLRVGAHSTAILCVACVAAAFFAIKFLRKHAGAMSLLNASPLRLSAIIAIALAAMLGGVLVRQQEIDSYSILDVGELADTFHWKIWLCHGDQTCIASKLAALRDQVPESSNPPSEQVFRDQALGKIVKTSPEAMNLLNRLYGTDNRFLGIGLSLPSAKTSSSDARIPEYLVPNYNDTHTGVLVWKLDRQVDEDKSLSEIVQSAPAMMPDSPAKLEVCRADMRKHLTLENPLPAVVRFALIPQYRYSGCMGRKESQYVFASHLGMLMDHKLTVEEAERLSGFSLQRSTADQDLYVFVFIPPHADEIVQATWRNVVSLIPDTVQYCK